MVTVPRIAAVARAVAAARVGSFFIACTPFGGGGPGPVRLSLSGAGGGTAFWICGRTTVVLQRREHRASCQRTPEWNLERVPRAGASRPRAGPWRLPGQAAAPLRPEWDERPAARMVRWPSR